MGLCLCPYGASKKKEFEVLSEMFILHNLNVNLMSASTNELCCTCKCKPPS